MELKHSLIDVVYTNLIENIQDKEVQIQCVRLNDNEFFYIEKSGAKVNVTYHNNTCTIHRDSEAKSIIECDVNNITTATMTSDAGDFLFEVKTDYIAINESVIQVQYTLTQNKQVINKLNIKWTIKE